MSWSVRLFGKPCNVVRALKEHSEQLKDQCKIEYDAAMPHLVALVEQNFAQPGSGYTTPMVRIDASGSGISKMSAPGAPVAQVQRNCVVKVEAFYEQFVPDLPVHEPAKSSH